MKSTLLAIALFTIFTTIVSRADLVGYVTTGTEVVWTNFDTGEQVSLGPSGISDIRAMELSPDGTLYASDDDGYLWEINRNTGIGTLIGDMDRRIESLAFAPDGTLYAIHMVTGGEVGSRLKRIDTNTGIATQIGNSFDLSFWGLAINNTGRAIAWEYYSPSLYEISLIDGSITLLGALDVPIASLDFGPDNNLYSLWQGNFYSINLANLSASLVRELPISYYVNYRSSLALIPEPCTLLLLGLGSLLIRKR